MYNGRRKGGKGKGKGLDDLNHERGAKGKGKGEDQDNLGGRKGKGKGDDRPGSSLDWGLARTAERVQQPELRAADADQEGYGHEDGEGEKGRRQKGGCAPATTSALLPHCGAC